MTSLDSSASGTTLRQSPQKEPSKGCGFALIVIAFLLLGVAVGVGRFALSEVIYQYYINSSAGEEFYTAAEAIAWPSYDFWNSAYEAGMVEQVEEIRSTTSDETVRAEAEEILAELEQNGSDGELYTLLDEAQSPLNELSDWDISPVLGYSITLLHCVWPPLFIFGVLGVAIALVRNNRIDKKLREQISQQRA